VSARLPLSFKRCIAPRNDYEGPWSLAGRGVDSVEETGRGGAGGICREGGLAEDDAAEAEADATLCILDGERWRRTVGRARKFDLHFVSMPAELHFKQIKGM